MSADPAFSNMAALAEAGGGKGGSSSADRVSSMAGSQVAAAAGQIAAPSDAIDAIDAIDAALPQTQCTRCGYPDCRGYAQAIASGEADIDRCPPGGTEGIHRLAAVTGRPVLPLDASCGIEGPLRLAVIDEAACIGCTLCIKACPVDCIVGAAKLMHTVIAAQCTGCELCVPACPVDCIAMEAAGAGPDQPTGWAAWSAPQAEAARTRYRARAERLLRDEREREKRLVDRALAPAPAVRASPEATAETAARPPAARARSAVVDAALARARARRTGA